MASHDGDAQAGPQGDPALFVAAHSELFKEQKAGDPAATVEGCFPPASTLPIERVVQCLRVLARLFRERAHAFSSPPDGCRLRKRIFWVREATLHESLQGSDNEEGFADLRTVADYMLLPKLLVEALELEAAVVKARRDYFEAFAGYSLATATTSKPRLFDFLLRDDRFKALMLAAVRQSDLRIEFQKRLSYCLSGGELAREWWPTSTNIIVWCGLMDGLMGESLSEHGYNPGSDRVIGYTFGCIVAGREIPASALPEQSVADKAPVWPTFMRRTSGNPLCFAASQGSIAALQQFRDAGWDLTRPQDEMFACAATAPSRDALLWLVSLHPDAFKARGHEAFKSAVMAGDFDTARWVIETLGFPLEPMPVFDRHNADACTCAARRNNLEALKWLHLELGFELQPLVVVEACKHGNKEMMDWYFSRRTPAEDAIGDAWDWEALVAGLRRGHLALSLSLLDKGMPFYEGGRSMMLAAACEGFKGDTGVLDALVSVYPALLESTLGFWAFRYLAEAAGKFGYQQVLEWVVRRAMAEAGL